MLLIRGRRTEDLLIQLFYLAIRRVQAATGVSRLCKWMVVDMLLDWCVNIP
jgi:hypothetical protein